MNMQTSAMKQRNADSAHGTVRAEGLSPSIKTQKQVQQYVDGRVTKQVLRRSIVAEMRNRHADKYGKSI